MTTNRRIALLLFAVAATLPSRLHPFTVTVCTTANDIVKHRKILLRINLGPHERGILRDTLRFSVDTPSISLNQWQTSQQPSIVHPGIGKQQRALYTESFSATIAVSIDKHALDKLESTMVCVAAFSLSKEGTMSAQTVAVPLLQTQEQPNKDCYDVSRQPHAQPDPDTAAHEQPPRPLPTQKLTTELSVVNEFARLWHGFIGIFMGILHWQRLWIAYLLLALLYTLFLLKRHYPMLRFLLPASPRWNLELRRICFWTLLGITLYYIRSWLSTATCWLATAGLMMLITCYYAASVGKPRMFLEKLKLLIGFISGMLVIPLVLKGLLALHDNNIFEIFGK